MYSFPSTSNRCEPSPRAMKTGCPPTPRNARTGEFTPPGIFSTARRNSSSDFVCVMRNLPPRNTVALPRPAGSPRFLDGSIPARCPPSPRKVRRVLAHCFPADIRLHPIWGTGHLHWCHEAESGSLALRFAGLLPRFPPAGLRRLAPDPLHVRTSNLHGEFLSIHKISQAYPGVPDEHG